MIDKEFHEALKQFGADQFEHSTRSLSDHLIGTYQLLQSWGLTEETCLAGLFHSIYGTKYYHNRAVRLEDRERIQRIIGGQAEHLVYLFCVTDRREFFANIGCTSCVLYDTRAGKQWSITQDILDHLIAIDVANWIEMLPYIHDELSSTDIHRTLELFELGNGSLPCGAIKKLKELKIHFAQGLGESTILDQ